MPRTRWRLTKAEEVRYQEQALRLKAAGCDIEMVEEHPEPSRVRITQDEGLLTSYVADWSPSGVLYVLRVAIVSLVPRFIIRDHDLSAFAWDPLASFLTDPGLLWPYDDLYRLPDGSTLRRHEVLNHRIDKEGTLARGALMEGCFLARGHVPLANNYQHGSCMDVTLTIIDQFEERHSQSIRLFVDRSMRQNTHGTDKRRPAFSRQTARAGLYAIGES